MTLRELIAALAAADQNIVVENGFSEPHSYRGIYADLAFEPTPNTRVSEMLAAARSAVDSTFTGWKGGEFVMHDLVDVYLANIGDCGEELTKRTLHCMLEHGDKEHQA